MSQDQDPTAPTSPADAAAAAPANKRFATRRASRAAATIRSHDGMTAISCVVRDASSTGALVELLSHGSSVPNLPAEFVLTLPMERVAYNCRLVWTHGSSAGIAYTGPARMLAKKPPARILQQQKKPTTGIGRLLARAR